MAVTNPRKPSLLLSRLHFLMRVIGLTGAMCAAVGLVLLLPSLEGGDEASGKLGAQSIPFASADRIIAIGSDKMMAAVAAARHTALAPWMKPDHAAIGSINSPMQCMMKEICAQCLQRHVDPATGKEEFIFSCFNQDQEMDRVDFAHLNARLRQNTVQEKLSSLWLDHLLESSELPRV